MNQYAGPLKGCCQNLAYLIRCPDAVQIMAMGFMIRSQGTQWLACHQTTSSPILSYLQDELRAPPQPISSVTS
jgi:hypothetical protein